MIKTVAIRSRIITLLKSDMSLSLSDIVMTWIMPKIPNAIEAPTNTRVAIFCIPSSRLSGGLNFAYL